MDHKRSAVWNYFVKNVNGTSAKCNICNTDVKAKAGNTSNLKRHLEGKHDSAYKKMKAEEVKPNVPPATAQGTLESVLNKKQTVGEKLPSNSIRAKNITKCLTKMICVDFQPFSIVEDAGFRDFVHSLEPRYEIPSRHTISQDIVPSIYKEKKSSLQQQLKSAESICLTTDSWTSRMTESYLSLTAHYIDEEMELKSACLAVRYLPDSHTAENIANEIMSILAEYNIDVKENKTVLYMITDNARNFTNAVDVLGIQGKACFAHTLQLVIQDGLKQYRGLERILAKSRTIVGHFKRSTTADASLKKIQKQMELPQHRLKQEVSTRWNSSLHMLQRLLEQREAVSYILSTEDRVENLLLHEWKTVENLVNILKPFEIVTEMLSGYKYPTCSMIIPALHQLRGSLEEHKEMNDLRDFFMEQLQVRWPDVMSDPIYTLSTFLDPRFKLVCFSNEERENIINAVVQSMEHQFRANQSKHLHETDEDTSVSNTDDVNKRSVGLVCELPQKNNSKSNDAKHMFWASFKKKVQTEYAAGEANVTSHTLRNEVNQYLLLSPIELSKPNCPLKWWKENSSRFPNLHKLARQMLCISATSVPSESLFSKTGITVSDRRCSLKASTVENLVFLNCNWNL